jgi:LysR family transcriptional regulator, regulator for bpeEF and oprC
MDALSKFMDNAMDFAALRDFVSVVQAGSFAAAARATRMPKSTLSKRVQDLETSLGLRLLERTTRKLRLTPDGMLLFDHGHRLVTDVNDLERLMCDRDGAPCGRLRVSAPTLFGSAFMGRIAAAYTRRWPETAISVTFTDHHVDLIEEDFDCAIRVGPLVDSSLVVRTFAQSQSLVVGCPNILGQQAPPKNPSDLSRWPMVSFAPAGTPTSWRLARAGETQELHYESAVILGSFYAVRDAVRAGAGLALIPEFIVAEDIRAGALESVLEDWRGPEIDLSIVYPSRRHLSPRVRAFIEIVTGAFPSRTLTT